MDALRKKLEMITYDFFDKKDNKKIMSKWFEIKNYKVEQITKCKPSACDEIEVKDNRFRLISILP